MTIINKNKVSRYQRVLGNPVILTFNLRQPKTQYAYPQTKFEVIWPGYFFFFLVYEKLYIPIPISKVKATVKVTVFVVNDTSLHVSPAEIW